MNVQLLPCCFPGEGIRTVYIHIPHFSCSHLQGAKWTINPCVVEQVSCSTFNLLCYCSVKKYDSNYSCLNLLKFQSNSYLTYGSWYAFPVARSKAGRKTWFLDVLLCNLTFPVLPTHPYVATGASWVWGSCPQAALHFLIYVITSEAKILWNFWCSL